MEAFGRFPDVQLTSLAIYGVYKVGSRAKIGANFGPLRRRFTPQKYDFRTFSDGTHLWKLLGDFLSTFFRWRFMELISGLRCQIWAKIGRLI